MSFVPWNAGRTLPPARDTAELRERAAQLLPEIAREAADRERDRVLPYAFVRRIAEAGLISWRVPREHGGPSGRMSDVIRFVTDLASVDSNLAQALRPGFGFVETLLAAEDAAALDRWVPKLLAGQVFGNAGWERGGANGKITTRLARSGDHFTVNGRKFYSTGALYADWVFSFAIDDDEKEVGFIVPRDRPGVQLVDDFDAMGQRLTASGTTVFEQVTVQRDELRPPVDRTKRSPLPLLYQLYLGAVLAGIAKNAETDAVHFAQHHARPIKHSSAERSVDDPYVQQAVGEIASFAYAADATVQRAAARIDTAWEGGLTQALLTDASVEVAQAQFFAAHAALRAGELLFEVGGASTALREFNLDRHWRNARTVANHNPRQWKAAAVGHYRLTGVAPPTSGLF